MHLVDCDGATTSEMNFWAEEREEEEAAAATTCRISVTFRVEGSTRRSFVKVRAIPPVATKSDISWQSERDWQRTYP